MRTIKPDICFSANHILHISHICLPYRIHGTRLALSPQFIHELIQIIFGRAIFPGCYDAGNSGVITLCLRFCFLQIAVLHPLAQKGEQCHIKPRLSHQKHRACSVMGRVKPVRNRVQKYDSPQCKCRKWDCLQAAVTPVRLRQVPLRHPDPLFRFFHLHRTGNVFSCVCCVPGICRVFCICRPSPGLVCGALRGTRICPVPISRRIDDPRHEKIAERFIRLPLYQPDSKPKYRGNHGKYQHQLQIVLRI